MPDHPAGRPADLTLAEHEARAGRIVDRAIDAARSDPWRAKAKPEVAALKELPPDCKVEDESTQFRNSIRRSSDPVEMGEEQLQIHRSNASVRMVLS